jgi:hypothetical protein
MSSGIMFLMYRIRGFLVLLYIRNTLQHRDGAERWAGGK